MPEGITAEDLLNNIKDTFSDSSSGSKRKSVSFFDGDKSDAVSAQFNRLFGREKPVHHILGGGKSADVLLWRNKKVSAGGLAGATVVWILFEWLQYNLFSLVCFGLVIFVVGQFLWANASGYMSSSSSKVPRVVLPEELFVNIARTVGYEVNQGLAFLQNVACKGTIKQFAVVVGSLLIAAIISSWFNFLTVIYIGFIAAHSLPVIYEKYDNQIDGFVYNMLDQFQHHYGKLDKSVLSKIPKGGFKGKKLA